MLYVFGDYTLDTERYELHRTGVRLQIEPRVFNLLAYLIQHPGHIIAKDKLCMQLWPNQPSISDDRLTNCVAQARKVLGDTGQVQQFIQTVHGRGYRFSAPVTSRPHGEADRPAPAGPSRPRSTAAHDLDPAEAGLVLRILPPALSALPPHPEKTANTLAAAGPGILAAERRQLTVVVYHVLGFAELAVSRDPEVLLEVTRDYHTMCAEIVHRFAGHIAQAQVDGLVVYFGWPQTHEDDARRAVQTGLCLVEGLERLKQCHTQGWGVQLAAQVGIHTGLVVMSALGHGDPREPLALGTPPTIAARVQGLAAPDTVLITSTTLRLVEGYFICLPMSTHRLDTLSPSLTVYQVLQASPAQSRFEVKVTKGLTPLVGRDQEVALLRERWVQAKDGQGQIVVLSGEAGIGKSRLVQAFKESLAGEAHMRIECHCLPDYQQSALYPVVEHLRRLLRLRGGETPEEQLQTLEAALAPMDMPLEEVVPLFAVLLSLPLSTRYAPQPLTPLQQKQQTFAALLVWLLQEAERQPVCYIMEDLHWADPSTLEWLSLLIDQLPTARVLLLLLFRTDFRPPWAVHSHFTHLTLGCLSHRQTEGMIRHVVGGKSLPAEVVQQLVAKTDGVPLFVEELTKIVVESGLVKEGEGRYELTSPLPPLAIPATLHDSLMARLDRLGSAKQIAQLGAVVGREFAYEVLQAVSPMEAAALQQALAQLVDAELLYQRGLPPQSRYIFKHALIQEAAYQSLLRSTRRQYHQRIAQVLASQFPEMVDNHSELVAHHYTEAGLGAQAIPYWQRAGQREIERSGTIEAVGHLTKGLELLKTLPETPERHQQELTLQLTLGALLLTVKGQAIPEVGHAYTRAQELCQLVGDKRQLFSVLVGVWRLHLNRGELRTARELGERCLVLAQGLQDRALLQEAHVMLGSTLFLRGELVLARMHLEQGFALHDSQHRHLRTFIRGGDPGVVCLSRAAWTLWTLGYPDQALAKMREALTLAQASSHVHSLGFALRFGARLHQLRREVPLAQELAEAAMALVHEHGIVYQVGSGMWIQGWALAEQGSTEEGLVQLHKDLAARQALGTEQEVPHVLAALAQVYGKAGHTEDGLRVLAEALRLVHKNEERHYAAEIYRLKGELLLQQVVGRAVTRTNVVATAVGAKAEWERTTHASPLHNEAESCFRQALEITRHQGAKSLELRAVMSLSRLWRQQGKRAEACQMLAEIYGWFTEGFDTADLQEARALLAELAGEHGRAHNPVHTCGPNVTKILGGV